jgi:hypothetical protein
MMVSWETPDMKMQPFAKLHKVLLCPHNRVKAKFTINPQWEILRNKLLTAVKFHEYIFFLAIGSL